MNKIIEKKHFSEKVVQLVVEAPLIARSRRAGHFVIVRADEHGERIPLTIADSDTTAGSDLTEQLTTGFAEAQGLTKKQQVDLLSGLLLSESERAEEQYVYASEMKLLGAVSAQRLDVVLMDEYARDRLLADDYFLDLRTLDASFHELSGLNAGGTVLDISDTPFVRQAGFSGKVYLGVVQNAPHPERAAAYIHYLFQR